MESQSKSFIFGFIATFIVVGTFFYRIAINSWDQQIFFYSSDNRNPAAIGKRFDFSNLEGTQLMNQSQERLIASAKILMDKNKVGIELGHFVTKTFDGKKAFACNAYDTIELTFKAGDQLVSGRPPEMVVSGPCLIGNDNNRIAALWIPMGDILKTKSKNQILEYPDDGNLSVKFDNIGDEWPRVWGVASVKLVNKAKLNDQIHIDERRMMQIVEKPLTFFWADPEEESRIPSSF